MKTINITASEPQKPATPVQEPATAQPTQTDPPKSDDKPSEQKK